jgi:hypothetical protein
MLFGHIHDGVALAYVSDGVASIIATAEGNGSVRNTYRYKPYGSMLGRTGSGEADPPYLWLGLRGFTQSTTAFCDLQGKEEGWSIGLSSTTGMSVNAIGTGLNTISYVMGGNGNPSPLSYTFCDGCDSSTPDCDIPGGERVFCPIAGSIIAKVLFNEILDREKSKGACSVSWDVSFRLKFDKACIEMSPIDPKKKSAIDPLAKRCWLKKIDYECINEKGLIKRACPPGFKLPCTEKIFNFNHWELKLGSKIEQSDTKENAKVKLSQFSESKITINGKVIQGYCRKKAKPQPCPEPAV